MNEIGIFCNIRKAHKIPEVKNTTVKMEDLVKRNYDNTKHNQIIRATDVTYICAPCDAPQNFVYL